VSADGTTLFYRGNTRMMAAMLAARGEPAIAKRDSLFVELATHARAGRAPEDQ
jgi:hypothetical protein